MKLQTVDRYEVKIAALERKISQQQLNYDDLSKVCQSLESRLSKLEYPSIVDPSMMPHLMPPMMPHMMPQYPPRTECYSYNHIPNHLIQQVVGRHDAKIAALQARLSEERSKYATILELCLDLQMQINRNHEVSLNNDETIACEVKSIDHNAAESLKVVRNSSKFTDARVLLLEDKMDKLLYKLDLDDRDKELKRHANSDGPEPEPVLFEERAFGGTLPRSSTSEEDPEASDALNLNVLDRLLQVNKQLDVIGGMVNGGRDGQSVMGPNQEPKGRPPVTPSSSAKTVTFRSQQHVNGNTSPEPVACSSKSRNDFIQRASKVTKNKPKQRRDKTDYDAPKTPLESGVRRHPGDHEMDQRCSLMMIRNEDGSLVSEADVQKMISSCRPIRKPASNLGTNNQHNDSGHDDLNLSFNKEPSRPDPQGRSAKPCSFPDLLKSFELRRSHTTAVTKKSTNQKKASEPSDSDDGFDLI